MERFKIKCHQDSKLEFHIDYSSNEISAKTIRTTDVGDLLEMYFKSNPALARCVGLHVIDQLKGQVITDPDPRIRKSYICEHALTLTQQLGITRTKLVKIIPQEFQFEFCATYSDNDTYKYRNVHLIMNFENCIYLCRDPEGFLETIRDLHINAQFTKKAIKGITDYCKNQTFIPASYANKWKTKILKGKMTLHRTEPQ